VDNGDPNRASALHHVKTLRTTRPLGFPPTLQGSDEIFGRRDNATRATSLQPSDANQRGAEYGFVRRGNSYFHGHVKRLSELDNCSVEVGEPDPRGWTVVLSNGRQVGTVIDLLVDTDAMHVRYLIVDVEPGALPDVSASGSTALVRTEDVDLDGGFRRVTARQLACQDIHAKKEATVIIQFEAKIHQGMGAE